MFGTDASATGPAQEELTKVLQWVEGLVDQQGPYFLGKDFSLVSWLKCEECGEVLCWSCCACLHCLLDTTAADNITSVPRTFCHLQH
jgi:hypothetical protein